METVAALPPPTISPFFQHQNDTIPAYRGSSNNEPKSLVDLQRRRLVQQGMLFQLLKVRGHGLDNISRIT